MAAEVVLTHPNRDKARSKSTKAGVVLLLLVSAALIVAVTAGGWDRLQGAQGVSITYVIITLVMAFFVLRWNRGVLPLAAGLAIIFAVIAAVSVPAWFARDKAGFADPALEPGLLGLLTLVLIAVQCMLILFAVVGFTQAWNVEVEVPRGREGHPDDRDRFDDGDDERFDYEDEIVQDGRTDAHTQPGTDTDPQADRGPQSPDAESEGGADMGDHTTQR